MRLDMDNTTLPDHAGWNVGRHQVEYYFSTDNLCKDTWIFGICFHE